MRSGGGSRGGACACENIVSKMVGDGAVSWVASWSIVFWIIGMSGDCEREGDGSKFGLDREEC